MCGWSEGILVRTFFADKQSGEYAHFIRPFRGGKGVKCTFPNGLGPQRHAPNWPSDHQHDPANRNPLWHTCSARKYHNPLP